MEEIRDEHELLARLIRWRPKVNQPLENFVTEAVAFLIKFCAPFREKMIRGLLKIDVGPIHPEEIHVFTQYPVAQITVGGKPYRPHADMFIAMSGLVICVENKIELEVDKEKDVDNYLEALRRIPQTTSRMHVLVTKADSLPSFSTADGILVRALHWEDVYPLLQEVSRLPRADHMGSIFEDAQSFLVANVIRLFEENGMDTFDGFTPSELTTVQGIPALIKKARQFVERVFLRGRWKHTAIRLAELSVGSYFQCRVEDARVEDLLWVGCRFDAKFPNLVFKLLPKGTAGQKAIDRASELGHDDGYIKEMKPRGGLDSASRCVSVDISGVGLDGAKQVEEGYKIYKKEMERLRSIGVEATEDLTAQSAM